MSLQQGFKKLKFLLEALVLSAKALTSCWENLVALAGYQCSVVKEGCNNNILREWLHKFTWKSCLHCVFTGTIIIKVGHLGGK